MHKIQGQALKEPQLFIITRRQIDESWVAVRVFDPVLPFLSQTAFIPYLVL